MSSPQRTARIAGVLYFVTHVTSVAAALLYGGSAKDPLAPLGSRQAVLTGAALEVILAVAVVGTGVALYPLVRRFSATTATGYLALRTLEASVILMGVVVLLPAVARPGIAGSPGLSAQSVDALRLVHDWTFLVGPGLVVPFHTALLSALLWRTRQVPRIVSGLGLVGGPLVGAMNLAVMFGVSTVIPILVIPVFAWEIGLAGYLILRGFAVDRSAPQVG